jgi:leader peptidase (prepilin peptidase)/N-methyltransferase
MSIYEIVFSSFAFILGASIGSFLNVCIYRMPRDLSINEPKRSFCPSCKYQIPWYRNLPLISWLSLRGKCANCGAPISFRYFGVELLTGLLFLAIWLKVWPHAWILALPYWVMIALFIVATFIDFEHFIIPDEITWGGAVAGVVLSLAIPTLHGVKSPIEGGMWAVAGAALGYFLLWGIVIAGKAAFGRKRIKFKEPSPFKWRRKVMSRRSRQRAKPTLGLNSSRTKRRSCG